MIKHETAAEKLIRVLNNDYKPESRVRMKPMELALSPRNSVPTGIFETSVGLSKTDKHWNVVIYFIVGNVLICRLRTVDMSYSHACDMFKIISFSETLERNVRVNTQRLYKKHDEYKIIQEIIANVLERERAEREGSKGPSVQAAASA